MEHSILLNTSLKEMISGDEIRIFTDPVTAFVNINTDDAEPDYLIELFDISGKTILSERQKAKIIKLDLGRILPGLYIVRLSGLRRIITRRIIKN